MGDLVDLILNGSETYSVDVLVRIIVILISLEFVASLVNGLMGRK